MASEDKLITVGVLKEYTDNKVIPALNKKADLVDGYVKESQLKLKTINGKTIWGIGNIVIEAASTSIGTLVMNHTQTGGSDSDISSAKMYYTVDGVETEYTGSVSIQPGKVVSFRFESIVGYATPTIASQTMVDSGLTISGEYQTTPVTVSITSNQGLSDTVIAAVQATVSYTYNGQQYSNTVSNGQSVKVPTGTTAIVSFPDVDRYAKVVSNNSCEYDTTLVLVNIKKDGTAISDKLATVSYTGGSNQVIGNGDSAKVPTGTQFTVTYSEIQNYGTPSSYTTTAAGTSITAPAVDYQQGVFTMSKSSNLTGDTSISTAKMYYSTNGGTTWTEYTQPMPFESGTTINYRWEDVAGYKTPDAGSTTMSTSGINASGIYCTEKVIVTVTAIDVNSNNVSVAGTKITINGTEYTLDATGVIETKVASSTVYSIIAGSWAGSSKYVTPDVTDYAGHTASSTVDATWNVSLQYVEKTEEEITGYIINQSNGSAAAADMIEITTPAMNSNDEDDVIHRIHSNTKLYGSTGLSNGSLLVKEISRSNKALYADGTSVASTDDVFMKLPEFWWKVSEVTTGSNRWNVLFSTDAQDTNNGWKHWEGNTFIGCYEAYNISNRVYSRSGVTPTVDVSQANFKTYARARGAGYQIVTWEAHCIMALLGYGWLGTTDDQSIVGFGSSTYPRTTGKCNAKGINDTTYNVDGDTNSINFWGLENWWGDIYEWVDNVETIGSGSIKVMDIDGAVVRSVSGRNINGNCISTMVLGEYGDMLPSSAHSDANYTTGYASYGDVYSSAGRVAARSYDGSDANGGLGYLSVYSSASNAYSTVGSRLLYKGNYTVID